MRLPSGEIASGRKFVSVTSSPVGSAMLRRIGELAAPGFELPAPSFQPPANSMTAAVAAIAARTDPDDPRWMDPPAPRKRRGRGDRVALFQFQPRVGDGAQTLARILLEAAAQQPADRRRRLGRQRVPVRLRLEDGRQHLRQVVAREAARTGQHLVEDDAEGPDVGAPIDRLAARLLGRHVGGRADDGAERRRTLRHRRRVQRIGGAARVIRSERLRETEVEHLDRAVGPHLDVRRLQIAMDDAVLVRGLEGVGDLPRDRQSLGDRQRPPRR